MTLADFLDSSRTLVGLIPSVLFLAAVILGAWAYARVHISKAQEVAMITWRQNFEAQEARAKLAEEKAEEQREAKHLLMAELAAEKLKTDQTVVLTELLNNRETMTLAVVKSEERIVGALGELTGTLEKIAAAVVNGDVTGHRRS